VGTPEFKGASAFACLASAWQPAVQQLCASAPLREFIKLKGVFHEF